jgi:ribosome-associated translation inhibitor RaiA
MNITFRSARAELTPQTKVHIEEKFSSIERLLGSDAEHARLELDIEHAPAEGRSAQPYRLVANLSYGSTVLHGEAVKPTPESAADRVRNELNHEIRKARGKDGYLRRKGTAIKDFFRFGK